jgi:hypothetical protein
MRRSGKAMTNAEIVRAEFEALRAGYVRGLHGIPLSVDDVGLSVDELRAKYPLASYDLGAGT